MEKLQCSPSVARILVREAHKQQFPDYYSLREKVIRIAMQNATTDRIGEVRDFSSLGKILWERLNSSCGDMKVPDHNCSGGKNYPT